MGERGRFVVNACEMPSHCSHGHNWGLRSPILFDRLATKYGRSRQLLVKGRPIAAVSIIGFSLVASSGVKQVPVDRGKISMTLPSHCSREHNWVSACLTPN